MLMPQSRDMSTFKVQEPPFLILYGRASRHAAEGVTTTLRQGLNALRGHNVPLPRPAELRVHHSQWSKLINRMQNRVHEDCLVRIVDVAYTSRRVKRTHASRVQECMK